MWKQSTHHYDIYAAMFPDAYVSIFLASGRLKIAILLAMRLNPSNTMCFAYVLINCLPTGMPPVNYDLISQIVARDR